LASFTGKVVITDDPDELKLPRVRFQAFPALPYPVDSMIHVGLFGRQARNVFTQPFVQPAVILILGLVDKRAHVSGSMESRLNVIPRLLGRKLGFKVLDCDLGGKACG
jgi:hypothetical protein